MGMDSQQPASIIKTSVPAVRGLLVTVGPALSRSSHALFLLGFVAVATERLAKAPGVRFIRNFSNSVLYSGTLSAVSRTHLLVHGATGGHSPFKSSRAFGAPHGQGGSLMQYGALLIADHPFPAKRK